MFTFKGVVNEHRKRSSSSQSDTQQNEQQQQQAKSPIEKLKETTNKLRPAQLGPSSPFNAKKLAQQSAHLRARLGELQHGLRLDLQRSLGKLARAGKVAASSATAKRGVEFADPQQQQQQQPARNRQQARSVVLRRSQSLNPRQQAAATLGSRPARGQPSERAKKSAPERRNEWATRSLHHASLAAGECARQQPQQPLASRIMSSWAGAIKSQGEPATSKRDKQARAPASRQATSEQDDQARSSSIVSLLSTAAASRRRRQPARPSLASCRLPSGARLLFVALLELLFVLAVILAPNELRAGGGLAPPSNNHLLLVEGAPLAGQFPSPIRPIWLNDGLMDVSDASSLDADSTADSAPTDPPADDEQVPAGRFEILQERPGLLRGPPKRSGWYSLASPAANLRDSTHDPDQEQDEEALAMVLPMKRRQSSATNGDDERPAGEFLWIERRRLNRDRALEPPAWLRTRPIRRGGPSVAPEGLQESPEADEEEQSQTRSQSANSAGDDPQQQQQQQSNAARPIRRRSSRGRQLRESNNEIYEEILRHLLEEAVGGQSSFLEALYSDLEARLRSGDQSGGPSSGSSSSSLGLDGQLGLAGKADKGSGQAGSQTGSEQENTLVVAGDEVSSEDDVTPLEPPVAAGLPGRLMELRKQPPGALTGGGASANDAAAAASLDRIQAGRQQFDRLVQASANAALLSPAELTSVDAPTAGPGGLIELMGAAAGPPAGEPEQSFHVVEDIDQVDSGQEIVRPEEQNQSQTQGRERDQPGQLEQSDRPDASLSLDKRSVELDSTLVGDFKQDDEDEQEEDEHRQQVGGPGQAEVELERVVAQLPVAQKIARRASFGRDERTAAAAAAAARAAEAEQGGARKMAVARALLARLGVARGQPLAATAVKLIQSGFFTRAQLIRFATKLKLFLEDRLALERGAITGLFPLNRRQLMVTLNPERIGPAQRQTLAANFEYAPGSGSLVLNWPGEASPQQQQQHKLGAENPLPILSAILNALYDDDEAAAGGQRMQFEGPPAEDSLEGTTTNQQQEEDDDDDEATAAPSGEQINELRRLIGEQRAAAPLSSPRRIQSDPEELLLQANERQGQDDDEGPLDEELENARPEDGPWSGLFSSPLASDKRLGRARLVSLVGQSGRLLGTPPAWPMGPVDLQWAPQPQPLLPPVGNWPAEYFATPTREGGVFAGPQVLAAPSAALATYLGALYGLGRLAPQQPRPLAPPVPLTSEELEELAVWGRKLALGGSQGAAALAGGRDNETEVGVAQVPRAAHQRLLAAFGFDLLTGKPLRPSESESSTLVAVHLIAVLIALAATFLIVKLVLRRFDGTRGGNNSRRRRLASMSESPSSSTLGSTSKRVWSSLGGSKWTLLGGRKGSRSEVDVEAVDSSGECATIEGETVSGCKKELGLGRAAAGNLHKRGLSADSGLETIDGTVAGDATNPSEKIKRSFEHLTHRLTRLLSLMRTQTGSQDDPKQQQQQQQPQQQQVVEQGGEQVAAEPKQQFRSSTSYIRSLIEALTKAASAQMSASSTQTGASLNHDDDDDDDDGDEDEDQDGFELGASSANRSGTTKMANQVFQVEDETEVLMSQMDISAAHLILDYMEKHLVDKERLRREWLELNATPRAGRQATGGSGGGQATNKANQLVLQRLAKVALNEENFHKNRNPNVVPFDRNRVRLGARKSSSSGGESSPPPTTGGGPRGKNATKSHRANLKHQVGDYVNASFIYDDDPRRPTHIIAQGPKEQTCGHFWQMVWEQEISVIVMLTRLNENGTHMCACYWPTQIALGGGSATPTADCNQEPNGKQSKVDSPPPVPANQRRGSVTSVFSGLAAGPKQGAGGAPPGSPIVSSGALNDNVLYFEVPAGGAAGGQTSSSSAEERDLEAAPQATKQQQQQQQRNAHSPIKLEVHLISEHISSSDYLVRNMYLINRATGETRTVSQFHYLAWQEGRTPESVRSFLQFRRKVHKSYRNPTSPILVHCSDGAGRSGTFALIDIILERIRNGAKEIDLRATLEHLRDQRIGLCETQSQFEFVLVALAEEIQIILNALPQ